MKKLKRFTLSMSLLALILTGVNGIWAVAQSSRTYTQHLSYDNKDREASFTYANGQVETYQYNDLDYRTQVSTNGFSRSHSEWDLQGRYHRTSTSSNNTSFGTISAADTRYSYNGYGKLRSQVSTIKGVDYYAARNIDYNVRGMLEQYQLNGGGFDGTVAYTYGDQSELTSFTIAGQTIDYTYDPHGNMLAHNAALDMQAFQSSFNNGNPYHNDNWSYDPAGRVTDDGVYKYYYNNANRIALIRDSKTRKVVASYIYDAGGQRVRVLDEQEREQHSIRDFHDSVASEIIVDRAGNASQTQNFVRFGDTLAATFTYDASNQLADVEHAIADNFGNPVLRWDANEVKRQEYSPYGQQLSDNTYRTGPHGFTGVHSDDETGLIYMSARYYDPVSTSFLRPDPAYDFNPLVPMSYNLYCYTYNNPVNHIDPDGLGSLAVGFSGRAELGNFAQFAINQTGKLFGKNLQVPLGYAANVRFEANYTTGEFAVITQYTKIDSGISTGLATAGVAFETTNAQSMEQRLGPSRSHDINFTPSPVGVGATDGEGYEGLIIEAGVGVGTVRTGGLPMGAGVTSGTDHTVKAWVWKGPGQALGNWFADLLSPDQADGILAATEVVEQGVDLVNNAAEQAGLMLAEAIYGDAEGGSDPNSSRKKETDKPQTPNEDTVQRNVQ